MRKLGRDQEKRENLDRWLLTYADMITLLMAFFIMMYSMSVLNLAKFRQAAISIRSGFNGMMRGQGKSVLGTSGVFAAKPSAITGDTAGVSWQVIKPLVNYIRTASDGQGVASIGEDKRGIVISVMSDNVLFAPGSAELKADGYQLLDRIAETISEVENQVQVEGHTCNLKPRASRYASNWELSTARATNVLRYLVEAKGLDADRFSAAGYGSVRPVEKNDTEAHRRRNRRVEIVLLRPEPLLGGASSSGGYPPAEIRSRD